MTRANPFPFAAHLAARAKRNRAYRRVLYTGKREQLVAMSIPPGASIGKERHARVEQLLSVVAGRARIVTPRRTIALKAGDVVVVPPGTTHDVVNTGSRPLKLATVYAPPNHPAGTVHATHAAAEADRADAAYGARANRAPRRR